MRANSLIATYSYNALGQRTRKEIEGITIFYHYDLNGLLLSESHASNTLYIDYLGFDNRPLAQLTTQKLSTGGLSTSEVVYLHSDHLNTPRIGTDALGSVVWQWQSDAFGVKIPVANQPNNSVVNLRFPGQYYDMETGLYYNYHRYYDPQTGRYITSDPIGLEGGLNTFGYVGGNPLNYIDPTGEAITDKICKLIPQCKAAVVWTFKKVLEGCKWVWKKVRAGDKNPESKEFTMDSTQMGKKLGKHVQDFGGDPSNATDRQNVINRINDIANNPDEIVQGTFKGQGSNNTRGVVDFRIQGNDVVVTTPDGSFVTILKDGVKNNTSVKNALGEP